MYVTRFVLRSEMRVIYLERSCLDGPFMSDVGVRAVQAADLAVRGAQALADRLVVKYAGRITGYLRLPAVEPRLRTFPEYLSKATRTSRLISDAASDSPQNTAP
jgi:hypothetical protein